MLNIDEPAISTVALSAGHGKPQYLACEIVAEAEGWPLVDGFFERLADRDADDAAIGAVADR